MTKAPVDLQELRRRIFWKAKSEEKHRFWGIFVHVTKLEVLEEAYRQAKRNGGAPGVDGCRFEDIDRDYATVLPTAVKNWFWERLSPSLTFQTVLFSKPNFLVEGMIAQIWAKSQYSPEFGHTNPSATRC